MVKLPGTFVLALLVVIAACGGGQVGTVQEDGTTTTTSTSTPDPPAPPEAAGTEAEEESTTTTAVDDPLQPITVELTEPTVWEDSGLRVEITSIAFARVDTESDEFAEAVELELIEPDVQSAIAIEPTVTNDSELDLEFFPDQGTLQVGPHQEDANLWLTTGRPLGGTLLSGTTRSGQVLWFFPAPMDELIGAGEARYVVSGAFDSDSFETVTGDLDVTLTWESPG